MSEMVFNCPHCEAAVSVDPQYAGQTVACPHCQGGIIVPAAPEPEAAAALPVETPAEPPAEEPVVAPTDAPTEPPVESPAETPAKTPAETPVEPPVDAPAEDPPGDPVPALEGEALIEFPCPSCGAELEIPESAIGEPVACPDCRTEVTKAVTLPKPASGKKKIIMKKKSVQPMAGR